MRSSVTFVLLFCLVAIVLAEQDCNKVDDHFCLPRDRCSGEAINQMVKSCAEGSVCCNRSRNTIDPCRNRAGGECTTDHCATEELPGSCPAPQKCCVRLR